MSKLVAWLSKEKPFWKFFIHLPVTVIVIIVVTLIGASVAGLFFPDEMVEHQGQLTREAFRQFGAGKALLIADIIGPILEESFFRLLLIGVPFLLYWVWMKRQLNPWAALALVLATSAFFGYSHGTPANVLMQGVAGIGFAIVFLKWSVYGRRIFLGFCASTMTHSAMNTLLLSGRLIQFLRHVS